MTTQIDSAWIAAHPVPVHGGGTTKNSRGHVVLFGGSRGVPGAPRLTVEAAMRAGAGKVQVGTIASITTALGVLLPEAGMLPLEEDDEGELVITVSDRLAQAVDRCDTVLVGPGMVSSNAAERAARSASEAAADTALVLDAAALAAADAVRGRAGPLLLTPNHDEMAKLLGCDVARISSDPERAATTAAAKFGATVALKGHETFIVGPDTGMLHYPGGGIGLATGGSGDVLAGALAGLLSRGMAPREAAGWAVWLHGQAGRRLAAEPGPVGFLARELPGQFPRLLPQ